MKVNAFIDTGYIRALLNRLDPLHAKASALPISAYRDCYTSEFIFCETLAALSKGEQLRKAAVAYIEFLRTQPNVHITPASASLFQRALDLFKSRNDQTWSLVDCSSFVIMGDFAISDAFAHDGDFSQAGFNPLIK